MGVQGLMTLLRSSCKPTHTYLKRGSTNELNLVVIDGGALKHHITDLVGDAACADTYYITALRFLHMLKSCGFECVVIFDGSTTVGAEETMVLRANASTPVFHTAAFHQAVIDAGDIQRVFAKSSADDLCYAWCKHHHDRLFALLTNDTDFIVLGVSRVIFLNQLTMDTGGIAVSIYLSDQCWRQLRQIHSTTSGSVSIQRRCEAAILLGNDKSKDVRKRMASRRRDGSSGRVSSPVSAALWLLGVSGSAPLTLDYFRRSLRLTNFNEVDLLAFHDAVDAYTGLIAIDAQVVIDEICLKPHHVPWLKPEMFARLYQHNGPVSAFSGLALRGICSCYEPVTAACLAACAPALFVDAKHQRPLYIYHAPSKSLFAIGTTTTTASTSTGNDDDDDWFQPECITDLQLGVRVQPAPSFDDLPTLGESPTATANALYDWMVAHPLALGLAPTSDVAKSHARPLSIGLALAMHGTSASQWDPVLARALLLPAHPDIPTSEQLAPATDNDNDDDDDEDEDDAGGDGFNLTLNTVLAKGEWDSMDENSVVRAARESSSFKILQQIESEMELYKVPVRITALDSVRLFIDSLAESVDADTPDRWTDLNLYLPAADGGGASGSVPASPLKHRELICNRLAKTAPFTARWLKALEGRTAQDALFLRHAAVAAGTNADGNDTLEEKAAVIHWKSLLADERKKALLMMHTSDNKVSISTGVPQMHKHQAQLNDVVKTQLDEIALAPEPGATLPMHVIYSTPTGSGKTFSFLLLNKFLPSLSSRHIFIYTVPAKQVLLRVGSDCEANEMRFWTAALVAGTQNSFMVRRPYSIRTPGSGERKKDHLDSGPMLDMLNDNISVAKKFKDKRPLPAVIIADVAATLEILRIAHSCAATYPFHKDRLVLFFDEPNMGIEIDARHRKMVRQTMSLLPTTSILASATLGTWENLPSWWKGRHARPANRLVITQQPYDLPTCELALFENNKLHSFSLLSLFGSYSALARTFDDSVASQRKLVLLMRHLSSRHANAITKVDPRDWHALFTSAASAREEFVEPALRAITDKEFDEMRTKWTRAAEEKAAGLRSLISTTGITLVAALHPDVVARELSGLSEEGFEEKRKELRKKVNDKEEDRKKHEKTQQSLSNKKTKIDKDDVAQGDGDFDDMVKLRSNFRVPLGRAKAMEEDTRVFLSKGIVIAHPKADPLMIQQFQEAVLAVPESSLNKAKKPALNVLIVDYSSIYGLDCPAVDTIVLCDDLGQHLSNDDLLQFLGRLRRDGKAIFTSFSTLTHATVGRDVWTTTFQEALEAIWATYVAEDRTDENLYVKGKDAVVRYAHTDVCDGDAAGVIGVLAMSESLVASAGKASKARTLAAWKALKAILKQLKGMVLRQKGASDEEKEHRVVIQQVAFLHHIAEFLHTHSDVDDKGIFTQLYNEDLVSNEALTFWLEHAAVSLPGAQEFIDELDDEDDEDDEDEEEDDE